MKEWPAVPNTPEDDEPAKPSRRGFMLGGAAAAAVAAGGAAALGAQKLSMQEGPRTKEEFRTHEPSEVFTKQTEGFATLYGSLPRDEVLFVDDDGGPLERVKLEPLTVQIPGSKDRPAQNVPVLPGKGDAQHQFDANNLLLGELNPEWVAHKRLELREKHPEVTCSIANKLPRELNSFYLIRDAIENKDDPIDPETYLDVVKHFGEKEVIDGGGLNRIQYIEQHALENADLPPTLKAELKPLILGLAAQESHLNNASVSKAGAVGIFQFLPSTWETLGRKPEEISSLVAQVDAVGTYFENAYKEMLHYDEHGVKYEDGSFRHVGVLEHIKQAYFDGDEDAYYKYFLAPLLINSYNAGRGGLYEIAAWFSEHLPHRSAKDHVYPNGYGYDFFHRMTISAQGHPSDSDYRYIGGYKHNASEYFPRSYAFTQLLKKAA